MLTIEPLIYQKAWGPRSPTSHNRFRLTRNSIAQ